MTARLKSPVSQHRGHGANARGLVGCPGGNGTGWHAFCGVSRRMSLSGYDHRYVIVRVQSNHFVGHDLKVGVADGNASPGAGHLVDPKALCWNYSLV